MWRLTASVVYVVLVVQQVKGLAELLWKPHNVSLNPAAGTWRYITHICNVNAGKAPVMEAPQ